MSFQKKKIRKESVSRETLSCRKQPKGKISEFFHASISFNPYVLVFLPLYLAPLLLSFPWCLSKDTLIRAH